MKGVNVDQYISDFTQLATDANYDLDAEGTRLLFTRGLPIFVAEEVIKINPLTWPALRWAAVDCTAAYNHINIIVRGYGNPANHFTTNNGRQGGRPQQGPWRQTTTTTQNPRQQFNSSNAPRTMNNTPVPMDLSRTRGFRRGSMQGNVAQTQGRDRSQMKCFNCEKTGHFARDCRSAKKTRIAEADTQDQMSNGDEDTLVDWTPAPSNTVQDTVRAVRTFSLDQQQQFTTELGLAEGQGFQNV
jgi:hypothetical protein